MSNHSPSDPVSLTCILTFPASQLAAISQMQPGSEPMSQPLSDHGGPAPKLRLFQPDEPAQSPLTNAADSASLGSSAAPVDTRIHNPGVHPSSPFQRIVSRYETGPQPLALEEIAVIRETRTLVEFYRDWMAPHRQRQLRAKKVTGNTLSKERQALNRWREWELANRPDDWSGDWSGVPIGFLAGGYLDEFYAAMAKKYASQTVVSTRNHLRTILNFAVQIGALDEAPQPQPLDLEDPEDVEEDLATVWSDEELDALYRSASGRFDLQTAIVLAVNCGPRSVDLFTLTWRKNICLHEDVPMLRFRARKTGKKHGIPLHPVVVDHLQRLRADESFDPGGPVFPDLGSVACKDPERSRAARARNKLIKRCLAEASLPIHERPWQVMRATCCTRLNDIKSGIGSWVIGQGFDRAGTKLAEDFYYNPSRLAVSTILRSPQPAAFLR